MTETVRAAILSVDQGQVEAAYAVGMTGSQAMRRIVLPQAAMVAVPNIGNSLIGLFKDTSLVVIIGIFDLTQAAKTAVADAAWRGFSAEAYLFIACIYFIFCFSISRYSQSLEKHLQTGHQR